MAIMPSAWTLRFFHVLAITAPMRESRDHDEDQRLGFLNRSFSILSRSRTPFGLQ
jgi:hypothetical protein